MADIISEMDNMTDDEIRMQIALIDNVNIPNAVKETGHRLINVLADVANAFTESIGIKNSIDYEIKKVSDLVRDDTLKYKAVDRTQLKKMLWDRLCLMTPAIPKDEDNQKSTFEIVSKSIIDEAASVYMINKYMSPAHKIEEISIRYNNAFLNNIMSQLRNLDALQKKEYAEQIGRRLGMASMDVKRQVQKTLMPEKFNGEGIIDALKKQRSTAKLEAVIKLLGFEAFKTPEAEIKTFYQALKSMTRISKMQAVRYVWKISRSGDRKFYAPVDLMPSYIPADEKAAADEAEKEYMLMCQQVDKAEKELDRCIKDEENKLSRLNDITEKYEAATSKYDEIQGEFQKLEDVKDDYIKNRKTEDESKRYYADVNETKRELDRNREDYEKKKKKLHDIEREYEESKRKTEEKRENAVNLENIVKEQTLSRAKALKLKWCAFFFKFTFEDEVFESAVRQFNREELRNIEETLKEAHDSATMLAVGDEGQIKAYTGGKRTAVISYEEHRITGIGCM